MIRLDNTMRYMAINVITGENTGWAEDIYELHMRIAEMLSGGKYPKVARYRTDPEKLYGSDQAQGRYGTGSRSFPDLQRIPACSV